MTHERLYEDDLDFQVLHVVSPERPCMRDEIINAICVAEGDDPRSLHPTRQRWLSGKVKRSIERLEESGLLEPVPSGWISRQLELPLPSGMDAHG